MENDHCQKVRRVSKIIANSKNQFKRKFIINPFQGAHVRFDVENLGASNSKCNTCYRYHKLKTMHFSHYHFSPKIWRRVSFNIFRFHNLYLAKVINSLFSFCLDHGFKTIMETMGT